MPTYFFSNPLNNAPKVCVDNRYDTFTNETTVVCHIDTKGDGTGAAQPFTHIFLKTGAVPALDGNGNPVINPDGTPQLKSGVDTYTVAASGGDVSSESRTLPLTLTDSSGYEVQPVVNDLHNDLFEWVHPNPPPDTPAGVKVPVTAKTLTFTFTGALVQIHQLLVLRCELIIADNGFSDIRWGLRKAGFEQRNARGSTRWVDGVAGDRTKYDIQLIALPKHRDRQDKVARALHSFFTEHRTFVFAQEPTRFPDQCFRAVGPENIQSQYASQWKARGRRVTFSIREA